MSLIKESFFEFEKEEDYFEDNNNIDNISFFSRNDNENNFDSSNSLTEINKEEPTIFNDNQKYFIPNDLQNIPKDKLLGRKKKDSKEIGKHTKYNRDDMTSKFKVRIERALLEIINPKIQEKNLNDPIKGKENKIKGILKINYQEKKDNTIDGNIELLSKSIKDFFSTDIASNYYSHPKDYNKIIIKTLYNSDNCKDITSILDMSFLECLKYYRKDKNIQSDSKYSYLKGLDEFYDKLKKEFSHDKEYLKKFVYLIKNFEKIYSKKKKSESPLKEI